MEARLRGLHLPSASLPSTQKEKNGRNSSDDELPSNARQKSKEELDRPPGVPLPELWPGALRIHRDGGEERSCRGAKGLFYALL